MVILPAVFALALAGCQSYRAEPLVPAERFSAVEAERAAPSEASEEPAFTFPRAVELMAAHGPSLKEARAEYVSALARARVKTPAPNPALELGPEYGFGPGVGNLYRLQPFGSLGFTITTAGKRKKQDELNRILAAQLFVELQARHRELYLDLRRQYAGWILEQARVAAQAEIEVSAGKSLAVGQKLVDAGFASALDLGLLDLEAARLKAATLDARRSLADVEGTLSETLGVQAERFRKPDDRPLPDLPAQAPALADLRRILLDNHPGLARLRVQYEAAEAALRLEVARQYPDIHLGPSYAGETSEKKRMLGLTLGIELPIFDRNQQAIAEARTRREEIRIKYEAAANRALAALERASRNIGFAVEKLALIERVLRPKAAANLDLARKALDAAATETLPYLETERAQRAVAIEAVEAEYDVRRAWVELEQAVGFPLIVFPGETPAAWPAWNEDAPEGERK
ncbi:MAG: TolC family protein [Planctomycetota bacterium]|nr:TolC family protein [Planctomycetota bacterium]